MSAPADGIKAKPVHIHAFSMRPTRDSTFPGEPG
jgi:hypothetical protein